MNHPSVTIYDYNNLQLNQDFSVALGCVTFVVRKGFVTDGASIPSIFHWLGFEPLGGDTLRAAIVHDALYQSEIYPRYTNDVIFLRIMKHDYVNLIKRWTYFLAVRIFGIFCFHPKKDLYIVNKAKKYIDVIHNGYSRHVL